MSTESSAVDQEAFNKAIFSHDFSFAEDLLSKVNIETQDYNGYTFLLKACVRNDVQVFEWLVQHGADINAQDRSSRNAMFIAIESVGVDIIKWLVEDKRLLHTTYRGQNPLHEAVLMNQLDMVKLLVAAGLNPYDQNPFKANVFDLAHAQTDTAILQWLLTNKSFDILDEPHDEKTKIEMLESLFDEYGYQFLNVKSDERNQTLADYAVDMQQIQVLKWLKSKNVLPQETPSFDVARSFDDALFNHKFDVASKLLLKIDLETRDYNGNTYLMKACVNNDVEAFNWLIQSGANIDAQHKSGRNVMFIAIDNHSLDILKWLANNKQLLSTTYKGQHPLHEAVSVNGLDMVKILVAAGVNSYFKNHRGDNAFDLAQGQSDEGILKWLLTNRSFEILEEAEYEQTKIAALENLFEKYDYKYLNDKSLERNSTIAEAAAKMQQTEILFWLKSKNISVDESLIRDEEAFRNALLNGEFDVASKLLLQVTIDRRYHNGNTCLMEACVSNNIKMFQWLVDHGADINVKHKFGRNLIFMAINSKSVDIVKWFTNKSLLYTIYNSNSPLHEAVLLGHLHMVKILVHAGLDPDVQNELENNAFDLAQTHSDKTILEWLLTNKSFQIMHAPQSEESKIATLKKLFDKYGYKYLNLRCDERNLTIAEYATKIQEVEILKWLQSKNIPVEKILLFGVQEFDEALFNHKFDVASKLLSKINIEAPDSYGNTYLIKACVNNNIEAFKWLILNDAKIDVQDTSGRNPIFAAIAHGSLDILKWLIEDKRFLHTVYKGRNPLHEAVLASDLDMVKLLVAAGLDPEAQNQTEANAFDSAKAQCNRGILEWLLTTKSFQILDEARDENSKVATLRSLFDKYGYQYLNLWSSERNSTIAEYAAKLQQVGVLRWLQSKNIPVDETQLGDLGEFEEALFNHQFDVASKLLSKIKIETTDSHGNTYLMRACLRNNIKAFKWLIANDADITAQDESGRNPIFAAIAFESLDIVEWLVADKRLLHTFYKGRNPLHEAVLVGRLDMVQMLVGAGIDPNTQNQNKNNVFDLARNEDEKLILKWLLMNKAFEILDEDQPESTKIATLKDLFVKYGDHNLRGTFAERNLTVAEYAVKTQQVEVLDWLKSKNIPMPETTVKYNLRNAAMTINNIVENKVHRFILRLSLVLAETTRYIEMNIRRNRRYKKELSNKSCIYTELQEFLIVPKIEFKIIPLYYPATVCTNKRCVQIIRIEGVSQKIYKKLCHSSCYLKGVLTEVPGDALLNKCWAMEDKDGMSICKHDFCDHNFSEHMHIDYITEIHDKEVSRTFGKRITKQDIEEKIKELDATIKKYEYEMSFILDCMAKFVYFLKYNGAEPYADIYREQIEMFINSEKKMADVDNKDLIARYERLMLAYEDQKNWTEEYFKCSSEYNRNAFKSKDYVMTRIEELLELPHIGKIIKDSGLMCYKKICCTEIKIY